MKYKPFNTEQVLQRIEERCMTCLNEDRCMTWECVFFQMKKRIINLDKENKALKVENKRLEHDLQTALEE